MFLALCIKLRIEKSYDENLAIYAVWNVMND